VAFDEWLDVSRRDQMNVVSELIQLARHMMRPRARLHADTARLKVDQSPPKLIARHPASQYDIAGFRHTNQMDVFLPRSMPIVTTRPFMLSVMADSFVEL
jgi:hypothetical protein